MKRSLLALCLCLACAAPPPSSDAGQQPPDSSVDASVPAVDAGFKADAGTDASTPTSDAGTDAGVPTLPDGGNATWYADALPIVRARCAGCHNAGGIAPFPLTAYAEALPHADAIARAVHERTMPPWMPDESCRPLKDSRSLSPEEIATLVAWQAAGARAGDPSDAPPAPDAGTGLANPDAVLTPAQAYTPSAGASDDYRCFILDPQLTQPRDVIALDIEPGVRSMVHHVVLYEVRKADALALQGNNNGWTCFGSPRTNNFAIVGGWVPGSPPSLYPQGTGVRLRAGTVIAMQVHYNLSASAPTPDLTRVALQYSPTPVQYPATIWGPIDNTFIVPPMAKGYVGSALESFAHRRIWGVLPHMHTRGKKIRVDSTSECFVDIPNWQFHWQQFYFFKSPVSLGADGTTRVLCTWDNPTNAPLRWGDSTADEMCVGFLYTTL